MTWNGFWPVADGHADTLTAAAEQGRFFQERSSKGHLDLPRLREAGVDLQVLALCSERRENPRAWAEELLSSFEKNTDALPDDVFWLRNKQDWKEWNDKKGIGVLLALEGLEPLEGDEGLLDEFYAKGIRLITLTWNYANPFGAGVLARGGLTKKGFAVVRRASELGMILDLSHLHPDGFWDVILHADPGPILVSHANSASITPHPRNLSDDQIRAVAERQGTVGLALYPPFLGETSNLMEMAYRHLEKIRTIGGEKCPALGCDFDGIGVTPPDIQEVTDLPKLFAGLSYRGWTNEAIHGVLGANLVRVLQGIA